VSWNLQFWYERTIVTLAVVSYKWVSGELGTRQFQVQRHV